MRQSIGSTGIVALVFIVFFKHLEAYGIYVNNFTFAEPRTSQITQMIEVCNEFNSFTNFVKMYVKESGMVKVVLNKYFKDFNSKSIMRNLLYIFNTIEEQYINRFMKIKWA